MPTYFAVGVTATLSVSSLEPSLTNVFDLKMGPEQRKDAQRVVDVLSNGRKLPERAISADGGEKGVQQFLGIREDLPFFMVEAGDGVRRKCVPKQGSDEWMTKACKASTHAVDVEDAESDSPLTSLAGTPSVGTPSQNIHGATLEDLSQSQLFPGLERGRGCLDQAGGPQALCLTIETCNKSFLARPESARTSGKDLKIEVFVNGQLAGTTFVNTRGSAVELKENKVRFQGLRIHRQMEKPWLYDSDAEGSKDHKPLSELFWHAIGDSLRKEGNARGRDKWGEPSPSAEYLFALAETETPEKGHYRSGIIDVVITAGTGKKFGPEAGYVLEPVRMTDDAYSTYTALPDPFMNDVMLLDDAAAAASPFHKIGVTALAAFSSSPEVPLFTQHAALPVTPTKKRKISSLTPDLGLNKLTLNKPIAPFETSRGKTGQRGRTVRQRLGDIGKMNPENQRKQLAALREELGDDELRALKKTLLEEEMMPSPSKKAKYDQSCTFALSMLADAALAGSETIDPMKVWRATPPPNLLPPAADAEAMLVQSRIDMALDAGAAFNGPLLRRIVSSSPKCTPQKRTRASALAHSPCSVPVKEQPSRTSAVQKTPTPQRRNIIMHNGSPIPIDPALTGTPPSTNKRSVKGANRTRHAWDPTEKPATHALDNFEVPELCKGSVVTYMEDGKHRQIGKARSGEFKEESLVVGMRFIVV